jgi:lactoylglutathione lyase
LNSEAKVEINVTQAVPFFMVSNMEESLRFYVDGLGFERTNQWIVEGKIRWCWLQHGAAALMLQEFHRPGQDFHSAIGTTGAGVSVWFQCKDALAIYREITSRGIAAKRPFVGNAMWDVSVIDPDGYRLHFESPTDAPEESLYSEPK